MRIVMFKKILFSFVLALLFAPFAAQASVSLKLDRAPDRANDNAALQNGAKLFINTSDLEGFPTTYLQAWQRGVPVLSFVNPDDLINPNRLGKVVKDLDEMSAALQDFAAGKLQFSNAHIEQFFQANFTIQAAVDQYEAVFQSVLENG